jgi:SAM-dependent methyltransferase
MMTGWNHGYNVSVGYSYGFFREMGPDWLDLCTRIAGFEPPLRNPSRRLRYLELGFGQGLGLCMLAAANPNAEFVGIDFQPEHVAHAQGLVDAAGLDNVRLIEADFSELAQTWPETLGTFDHVALHGIFSWVSPQLRADVVQCLLHATHPGSLVYASYNTLPGWYGTAPFQHITRLISEAFPASGSGALEQSVTLFEQLLEAKASIFDILPGLKSRIPHVRDRDISYFVHEYLHENWHPLWHSQVAREFEGAKLTYIGSATLAENMMPEVLPSELRQLVQQQPTDELRQDLQDLVINQGFRRDIYCRGPRPRAAKGLLGIEDTRLYLLSTVEQGHTARFETSFGEIAMEYRAFGELIEALADGPRSVSELLALPNPTKRKTRHILQLMLHGNILGVAAADPGNPEIAGLMNRAIAKGGSEGAPYGHLASSALASAVQASDIDLMLMDSWFQKDRAASLDELASGVAERLTALGRDLNYGGQPVPPSETKERLEQLASAFLEKTLPRWKQLGVTD